MNANRILKNRRRGFASLIGLLLVLLIIMTLVETGYFTKDKDTGKTQAQLYTDKTKNAACLSNRVTLRDEVQQILLSHGGQLPPKNVLKARLNQIKCPGRGVLQLDGQGNIYCSEHNPAPESMTASIIDLYDAPAQIAPDTEQPAQ